MLPDKWQQSAQENRKAYKYLLEKGNKKKILKELPQLHEAAFERVDCLQCANCCKNYSPRFKMPDIKRIAKVLRMKERELILNFLRMDEDGDYVTKSSPCPFLDEDNTCKIYEDRPSDCARYPYTNEDILVKRVNLTLKNATVCPATFLVLERLLELEKNKHF